MWILLAAFAGLASNIFNIFNRHILRTESDSTALGWITEIIRLVIGVGLLAFDPSMVSISRTIMHIGIVGTIEIISVYVFMKMHLYSHLSISTIIQRTRLIWVPVIAYILLGERLALFDYVGIAILFIGLSVSAAPRKIMTDKGMQYAYLSAFFAAVLAIATKSATRDLSVGWTLIAMSLLPTLIIPLFMKGASVRLKNALQVNPASKLISAGANTVAMILLTMSIKIGSLSIATAIYQSMMLVSILVGIFIFQEREGLAKKIIGGTITVIAILIITLL